MNRFMQICLASCLALGSYCEAQEKLYLNLVKDCVRDAIYKDPIIRDNRFAPLNETELHAPISPTLQTMVPIEGLDAIQQLMEDVVANNIEGDFIETGVWRGGNCIFMRAYLKSIGDTNRKVWVADSFCGVPPPSFPQDKGIDLYKLPILSVSLEQVQANFKRYGLLDEQVKFLPGWFKDTLPHAAIEKLAIMRLDGDLYESTMQALCYLYPKLSSGGYVIIDDYGAIPVCAQAVHEFRDALGITAPLHAVNWTEVYWQKP